MVNWDSRHPLGLWKWVAMWASVGPMNSMSNNDQLPALPHSQVCPEDQTDDPDPIPVGKLMETAR